MQARVREFLIEYNRRHGATILLTSHYMADVVALCKRVLVIDHGRLVYDGELESLVERISPVKYIRLVTQQPIGAEDLSPLRRGAFRGGIQGDAGRASRERRPPLRRSSFSCCPSRTSRSKTPKSKRSSAASSRRSSCRNEKVPRRVPGLLEPDDRISDHGRDLDAHDRPAADHARRMAFDRRERSCAEATIERRSSPTTSRPWSSAT